MRIPILWRLRARGAIDPSIERRRSVRHTAVHQIAKLVADGSQELCLLRDISSEGVRIEVYAPLFVGNPVTIELRTGHRETGQVAWWDEGQAGVRFDDPVPMLAMLSHCSFDERLTRIRPPRLDVDLPGSLLVGGEKRSVRVRDVSQGGMRLRTDTIIAIGSACEILVDGLAPLDATVRWNRDAHSGILLKTPMSFARFGAWRQSVPGAGAAV